jgi:DNA repair protein RadC
VVDPHVAPGEGDLAALVCLAIGWRDAARAEALVRAVGGVRGLRHATEEELVAAGVTRQAARRLRASFALQRLPSRRTGSVRCAEDLVRAVPNLADLPEERLIVILLDGQHQIVAVETVTTGSGAFTIVDPAQILRLVLAFRAPAFALAHNHPSGDPTPSWQDLEVTRKTTRAADAVGVRLLDHVIVASRGYVSLAERGEVVATPRGVPVVPM